MDKQTWHEAGLMLALNQVNILGSGPTKSCLASIFPAQQRHSNVCVEALWGRIHTHVNVRNHTPNFSHTLTATNATLSVLCRPLTQQDQD